MLPPLSRLYILLPHAAPTNAFASAVCTAVERDGIAHYREAWDVLIRSLENVATVAREDLRNTSQTIRSSIEKNAMPVRDDHNNLSSDESSDRHHNTVIQGHWMAIDRLVRYRPMHFMPLFLRDLFRLTGIQPTTASSSNRSAVTTRTTSGVLPLDEAWVTDMTREWCSLIGNAVRPVAREAAAVYGRRILQNTARNPPLQSKKRRRESLTNEWESLQSLATRRCSRIQESLVSNDGIEPTLKSEFSVRNSQPLSKDAIAAVTVDDPLDVDYEPAVLEGISDTFSIHSTDKPPERTRRIRPR